MPTALCLLGSRLRFQHNVICDLTSEASLDFSDAAGSLDFCKCKPQFFMPAIAVSPALLPALSAQRYVCLVK